jgi:hypothetical protein
MRLCETGGRHGADYEGFRPLEVTPVERRYRIGGTCWHQLKGTILL